MALPILLATELSFSQYRFSPTKSYSDLIFAQAMLGSASLLIMCPCYPIPTWVMFIMYSLPIHVNNNFACWSAFKLSALMHSNYM